MSAMMNLRRGLAPLALAVAITCALGACKKDAATDAAAPAAGQAAPAPPGGVGGAANVQAMGADQLREGASQGLRENRMYAPAGDNAMEYYLALRDKLPDDAGVSSALTDLMPYTVIAAEQSIAREEFTEAQRLAALIEKADPRRRRCRA
jgi:protein TonB